MVFRQVRMEVIPEEPALVGEADRFENYLARGMGISA